MSFSHAAGDIRAFQEAVARGLFQVLPTMIWPFSIAASRVDWDKRGNGALNRQMQRSRQDLIASCVIAAGLAHVAPADDDDDDDLVEVVNG